MILRATATAAHRAVVELVQRQADVAPDFVRAWLDEYGAAAAAWRGWLSLKGDELRDRAIVWSAAQWREYGEALAELEQLEPKKRIKPGKRHCIADPAAAIATIRAEIEARKLGEWKRRGRCPMQRRGEWFVFLVDVGGLDVAVIAELVLTAPASWSPPPFLESDIGIGSKGLGLAERIRGAVRGARKDER